MIKKVILLLLIISLLVASCTNTVPQMNQQSPGMNTAPANAVPSKPQYEPPPTAPTDESQTDIDY
ncbi:hypothetical protein COV18_04920 [Candidatus Woesearchaeota archaeon CG10_big_fil_rev_8_21_14_0_10_37_12]|nr:MAG: hypothetical protein COV18_04920 [Candidatus Woesearchaeota archaeon CG10_big_fil_rev_8_21_14_0_10_37_12]